ncbi:hypothetical protein DACRYDRAFT_60993, partial [Dacryopinax primogenitus]
MPAPRPRKQGSGQGSNSGSEDVYNPRRSPTLIRFNPADPDFQERQRTMDVDSAMQLSRARSGSVSTPVRPVVGSMSPSSPHLMRHMSSYRDSMDFPPLSETEEEALQRARDDYPHLVPEEALEDGGLSHTPSGTAPALVDTTGAHEPEYQHELEHTRMLMSDDPMDVAGMGPLPMYQASAYRSNFDFGPLEGFANEERNRLEAAKGTAEQGLQFFNNSGVGPASGSVAPLLDDGAVIRGEIIPPPTATGETFVQRRQRRLSQSTPTFRRQAKLAAAQAAAEAARTQGYANTEDPGRGHDRPYRFSFYSNALPAVIHARSLSELPAEGQSFDELFSGLEGESSTPPNGGLN